MTGFEYKVVPAPMRGLKAKGVKGTQARFANALQTVMNDLGAEGWEYQRTDTLPVEERQGLTGKTTSFQSMLVFRRTFTDTVDEAAQIAALIEDQSEVLNHSDDILDEEEEAPLEEPIEEIAAVEENAEDHPEEQIEEVPAPIAAEQRVAETLKAPFAFPWSRRTDTTAAKSDDSTETNIPAE